MADKIYYHLARHEIWSTVFSDWFEEYVVWHIASAAFNIKAYSKSHLGNYRLGLYYTFANALLLCADRHADIPKDIKTGMIRQAQALKGVIRTILASAEQPLPVEPRRFWEVLLELQKGGLNAELTLGLSRGRQSNLQHGSWKSRPGLSYCSSYTCHCRWL
jgi:hypothetical protein